MKKCKICKKKYKTRDFQRDRAAPSGQKAACRHCLNKRRRRYYAMHRSEESRKGSERDHLRKYGITVARKLQILAEQGNCCAICRTTDSGKNNWHTDHDHETKKIRGIVCGRCNLMLGHARDNPKFLRAGAAYLEKSNESDRTKSDDLATS